MPLFNARATKERDGRQFAFPLADGAQITLRTMVALDANGEAVAASATAGLTVVGIAEDFRGTDPVLALVRRGCFNFEADATDTPTRADIGKPVYAVDAVTVATAATGDRPQAGILLDVDELGCWVKI